MVDRIPEPDDDPIPRLAGDLRAVSGRLQRRLREEATLGDFSWSQIKVLLRLERDGPATVTALAQAEGVRPQSMGATVAVLKAAGLVEGRPDPADGRQTILSLTDLCRRTITANRARREDWLARVLQARFTAPERQTLARAVALLEQLLEP